jgi:hypothetical protein
MSRLAPLPAEAIDKAAQLREETWGAVDFVDDDQLVGMGVDEGFGVIEAAKVHFTFKVEIDRARPPRRRRGARKSCFADLARPKQHDGGLMGKPIFEVGLETSFENHGRKTNMTRSICGD